MLMTEPKKEKVYTLTAEEVIAELGITPSILSRLVREGRLTMPPVNPLARKRWKRLFSAEEVADLKKEIKS